MAKAASRRAVNLDGRPRKSRLACDCGRKAVVQMQTAILIAGRSRTIPWRAGEVNPRTSMISARQAVLIPLCASCQALERAACLENGQPQPVFIQLI